MPDEEIKYLDLAFLCDGATEKGGNLSALGIGLNLITAATLPTVQLVTLVLRLAWVDGVAQPGVRTLAVRFLAPSGTEVSAINAEFQVDASPTPHPELGVTGAMVFPVSLILEEAGVHQVEIVIEGTTYPPLLFKVVAGEIPAL